MKIPVEEVIERALELRRDIHRHPELSRMERRTSDLVRRELEALGLEARPLAGTAVAASLTPEKGQAPSGKVLLLRADMDALSVQEETGVPYASCHPGVMHACGHDCHVAILLGVAMALVRIRCELGGTVKFVFQPAEEDAPRGGALPMIEEGVLENPRVDAAVALHVWPDLPVGTIGVRPGPMMGASDRVTIRVRGRGGHAASPHQSVDAVVVAGSLISALQSIPSRSVDPPQAGSALFRDGSRREPL